MYRWILLFVLVACASQKHTMPEQLYGHGWETGDGSTSARFTISNNRKVVGNDGCNRIFGQVLVEKRLDFSKVASTRMACEHGQDRLFWDAIQAHDRWRIRNDELQLLKGKKVVLRLQKVDQAADKANSEAEE